MSNGNRAGLLLRLSGIELYRGKRHILHDISFDLYQGQILTIIGPNGAGKTSLLRVTLGLINDYQGEVWRQPNLRIGFMPQKLQLDPTLPLTVLRFMRLHQRYTEARVQRALQEVGVEHILYNPVQALSGGETQRMLLARALLRDPELLVLDEPVQGVDVHGQAELYSLLSRIRDERGCAILMVSHDLHLVMASTDRVVCLNQHLCCSGTPDAVVQNPEFIELFGAQVGANLAVYRHQQGHDHSHNRSPICTNPTCSEKPHG